MPRKVKLMAMVAALMVTFAVVSQANASLVTEFVKFTATDFSFDPPFTTVEGSFTVTYDPTVLYDDETSGITLNSLNIELGSPLAFSYHNHSLQVGGLNAGVIGVDPGTDDFNLWIWDFPMESEGLFFIYSQYLTPPYVTGSRWFSYTITVEASEVTPIPLPSGILLFGSGLLGLTGWRRLRKS